MSGAIPLLPHYFFLVWYWFKHRDNFTPILSPVSLFSKLQAYWLDIPKARYIRGCPYRNNIHVGKFTCSTGYMNRLKSVLLHETLSIFEISSRLGGTDQVYI
jgi:hypothetical protein